MLSLVDEQPVQQQPVRLMPVVVAQALNQVIQQPEDPARLNASEQVPSGQAQIEESQSISIDRARTGLEMQVLGELVNDISNSRSNIEKNSEIQNLLERKSFDIRKNPLDAIKLAKEFDDAGVVITQQDVTRALDDGAIEQKSNQEKSLLFVASLQNLPAESREEAGQDTIKHAIGQVSALDLATQVVSDNINDRLNNIGFSSIGIASGENDWLLIKGVWISGLYGASKQKRNKAILAYNANLFGATVGLDLNINDNVIVGATYSNINSNFKYKTNKANKTKVGSHIFSLYSESQISNYLI